MSSGWIRVTARTGAGGGELAGGSFLVEAVALVFFTESLDAVGAFGGAVFFIDELEDLSSLLGADLIALGAVLAKTSFLGGCLAVASFLDLLESALIELGFADVFLLADFEPVCFNALDLGGALLAEVDLGGVFFAVEDFAVEDLSLAEGTGRLLGG